MTKILIIADDLGIDSLVRLAKKYGGVRIRVAGNVLYPSAFHKQVYRSLLNNYFKRHSNPQNHIPNFARLEKFMAVNPTINGDSIELMTHPGMEQDYKLLNSQFLFGIYKKLQLNQIRSNSLDLTPRTLYFILYTLLGTRY
ncbi:MAG: hypothetical protein IPG90_21995 [Bacteroidetes bacterium]|nr:hypothetical protein [Bacteroidota bacterium]